MRFIPFLFFIVAEGLSGMMRKALSMSLFNELKVSGEGIEVSLLQFANDTRYLLGKHLFKMCWP